METLYIYALKSIVCSGVLLSYYFIFLKDKTFHHYNRFFLLFSVVMSLLLPLLKISYFTVEVSPQLFYLINGEKSSVAQPETPSFNLFNLIIISVLSLVSLFLLYRLLAGIWQIQKLKKQCQKEEIHGVSFYHTTRQDAPFSFFKNLFWKEDISLQSPVGQMIFKHEIVHITQGHSWDKLFISLVQVVFWFNPMFYFIKKELHLIHEYLADKKSIEQSNTKAFAEMLLASHFSSHAAHLANPFFSSHIKKRLTMLKKSNTSFAYLRKAATLPLIFILVFAYAVNTKNKEIKDFNNTVNQLVEQQNQTQKNTIVPANIAQDTTKKTLPLLENQDQNTSQQSKNETNKDLGWSLNSDKLNDAVVKLTQNAENIENYINSDDFQAQLKDIEKIAKEAEGQYLLAEKELKKALAQYDSLELKLNSKNFKIKLRQTEKAAQQAREAGKQAEKEAQEIRKTVNSKAFQQQVQQAKEAAKYAKKEAEKAKKELKAELKQLNLDFLEGKNTIIINKSDKDQPTKTKEYTYLLNGNPTNLKTIQQLQSKDIKVINITDRKDKREISITTKSK
ncbi:M56 family metallopeptidase [Riemerella columbina]|uniref:M56 family metallopeptidase n=1 Tax=Riemerella columbina TaxID=103810 RepID=UPI002670529D|nr:M56 family metallopeptidase [Riemerella columbina]WKS95815.1 hypothetical protein NYR17_03505 [Riemerella columbina]